MTLPSKILVVDDDELLRAATVRVLQTAGHQTLDAADGFEAVELARAQRPDLILMDINMPGLDGLEAMQRIKADPELGAIFVVIVSGSRIDPESQVRGLETGADGYLVRPISNRELLARVQSMLRIKSAEDAVRRQEKQLRVLISSSVDGMLVVNLEGRVLFANPAACELLNRAAATIVGEVLGVPVQAGEFVDLDLIRPDGRLRVVEMRVVELDWQSQPALLASLRDVTERKRQEEAIRNLNTALEARVESRTRDLREAQEKLVRQEKLAVLGQLAGSVGHELRSPLAVISNAVYLLKMFLAGTDPKVFEYLRMIEQEAVGAEKIITDLLDFARIKKVECEAVEVPELVERILQRFPPTETIRVVYDFPSDLPPLWVDGRQMEQVLGNLVLNACQVMEAGGELKISAQLVGRMVRLAVQDTGAGILPENLLKVFEPLYTTKTKGIGLGLPVSKGLVEANGGELTVTSRPGVGSTFTVSLPCADRAEN